VKIARKGQAATAKHYWEQGSHIDAVTYNQLLSER
jgi:hypothetical protein